MPKKTFFSAQVEKYGKKYCCYTATGREAIALALLSLETAQPELPRRCLMPAYMSDSVFLPFVNRGWELVFYTVDRGLLSYGEELFRLALENDPGLIFIHPYYGTDTCRELRAQLKALKKSGIFVMEDVTQSYYLEGVGNEADFVVGSLREWYAVPDGGFVTSEIPLAEEVLDQDSGIRRMSQTSMSILSETDEAAAANKRAENCDYLYDRTIGLRRFRPVLPKQGGEAPLYFPIYVREREDLQRFLAEEGVEAPVLWPVAESNRNALVGDGEYIYHHILALPVDQHRGIEDMERIVGTLAAYENQRVVGIRVDANKTIAMGHVMRCLTIAEELRKKGIRVVFFTADEWAKETLSRAGVEQICLHTRWDWMEEELPRLREMLALAGIGTMLVDSYQATPAYFEGLRGQVKLVCLDDCFEAVYPVDLLINYNAYHTRFPYKENYGTKTRLLLGTAYMPLREEFVRASDGETVKEDGNRFSVLLASGGGDTENALLGILERLVGQEAFADVTIHVAAGIYYPRGDELEAFAGAHTNVCVHRSSQDMAGLMRNCDAAASAAGTMLFELSAMQVPTVFFQTADNQRYDSEFFADEERMLYAGDIRQDREACLTAISEGLAKILGDEGLRARMREKLSLVTDGKGAERIAEEIAKL